MVSYDDFRRDFFTQHYRSLQLLPDDYTYTEVTVFFDDVKKYLALLDEQEKKAKEVEVGSFYKKANVEFYQHICQASQTKSVVVDTIIVSQQQKEMIEKSLHHNVVMAFVHVPFKAIVERIQRRNAAGVVEARYANRVLSVYPNFYTTVSNDDKSGFDGHISVQEIESAVEASTALPYSPQFCTGNALVQKITESFGIQKNTDQQKIKLVPMLSYDYIVDTGAATPDECALMLYNKLVLDSKFTH